MGEGAGLVKDDGVRLCCRFQELAALDGDVLASRFPHGESTASGMASFSAQEKSTMSTDSARGTFRVRAKLSRLPAKV